ncbi:unnamed protein product [Rotaria sp. Silwood2]|nr:unnamed protein product [Rotaria sp. Silwood2]CAF2604409.1 unnamed protein product [Rotaria sp. Silwood2]CAF2974189.1 unnamed protein product [Rotaria sp. Silwood2]CAF3926423.1 unnamed protein product [Rotaria sp. Silwood2]CAF4325080.1 unnamed protein product [Rotaria sp. Silwood2]
MRLILMENKNHIRISNVSSLTNNSKIETNTSPISFIISTSINPSTSSLDHTKSNKTYSENLVIAQPTVNELLSDTIKQEEFENNCIEEAYSISNRSETNICQLLPPPTVVTTVHLKPRETLNSLSTLPMTNTSSHLMSTLNPAHLSDGTGSYFVSGLSDLASNYKLNPSSNTDLPSPSSSSNSSNPPSSSQQQHQQQHHHLHPHQHQHHQVRRHGEGNDPTRKREMRLQKNREAARECRRKKKEYIKCLEERVAVLETQNKALIEELRQLKELYCQREETNNKNNSKTTTTTTATR